jgi:hypothetical protein
MKEQAVRALLVILALALSACSSAADTQAVSTGAPPLCAGGRDLGAVLVVAETRWRPDQKDVPTREAWAQRAIGHAFEGLPCGRVLAVTPIAATSSESDASLLAAHAESAPQTLVRVRVEELGPQLLISIPVLWRVNSDAKFHVRAIDAASGAVLLELDHRRIVGGPFSLRPAAMAEGEFETALKQVLTGG